MNMRPLTVQQERETELPTARIWGPWFEHGPRCSCNVCK